ncbi:MAG: imelysin family protein [Pseudomonadota bacterium]
MRYTTLAAAALIAAPAFADGPDIRAIVDDHILPGYAALAQETSELAQAAAEECSPKSAGLITAYHDAFDAWVRVSHLRFGPSEQDDRAFALAFWPDPRGSIPKALSALIRDEDAAVLDGDAFGAVSIAARGFYALEFLLFAPEFAPKDASPGDPDYRCHLIQAVATDVAVTSDAIYAGWIGGYGDLMATANNETYRTPIEAARQLFTALSTGLEFTSQTRLGRALGTFERPRPNRAEARRSGRSLRHVVLSLEATRDLAAMIAPGNAATDEAFQRAIQRAQALDDPVFAGVADPQGRFRVEVLQHHIESIRTVLAEDVGPSLGVAAGFNAMDGD